MHSIYVQYKYLHQVSTLYTRELFSCFLFYFVFSHDFNNMNNLKHIELFTCYTSFFKFFIFVDENKEMQVLDVVTVIDGGMLSVTCHCSKNRAVVE